MVDNVSSETRSVSNPLIVNTNKERLLICVVAALVPFLTMAYKYDSDRLPDFTSLQLLGYFLKAISILISGGIVIFFLVPEETDRRKLFLISVSAPAYLSTALGNAEAGRLADRTGGMRPDHVSIEIIHSAFAQHDPRLGQWPEESRFRQFVQGLTGTVPARTYWVQILSEDTAAEAIRDAENLQREKANLGYQFRAYPSYHKNGYFAVIMGGPFASYDEAARARQLAIAEKIVKDPLIFALPRG